MDETGRRTGNNKRRIIVKETEWEREGETGRQTETRVGEKAIFVDKGKRRYEKRNGMKKNAAEENMVKYS